MWVGDLRSELTQFLIGSSGYLENIVLIPVMQIGDYELGVIQKLRDSREKESRF